jgi:hypothetical protein
LRVEWRFLGLEWDEREVKRPHTQIRRMGHPPRVTLTSFHSAGFGLLFNE